ncbi:MAG: hypothetical protein NTW37_12485 [Proteobacteria bacterium]|nr:hypothetical protein [Pseudomonadota bacterium]
MERRGHLDPAELDALLLGGAQDRGVTVESFHVEGCRTCREALLDLALMAGILRGAKLRPALDSVSNYLSEPEAAEKDLASVQEAPRVLFSRRASVPRHPSDDALQALLDSAFDERVRAADFLADGRHVSRCDQCLVRMLRLSERFAPSAGLMSAILKAAGKGASGTEE